MSDSVPIIVKGVPTKWHRLGYRYSHTAQETRDEDEIVEAHLAIEADRAACGQCQQLEEKYGKNGFFPSHCTSVVNNGRAYTYHCRSGSRWFNPETRKMEGSAHCTCDGCF